MRNGFPGFPEEGLAFLRSIARHNNRDWFLPRKHLFEEHLKLPMKRLVECLNADLLKFAPEHITDPEKAVYRFYRDTRFSNDKTPYKDHVAAIFPRRGLGKHDGASYYFEVSHKTVGIAVGVYMPMPETLLALRTRLADRADDFRRLARARAVTQSLGEVKGESLRRVPKGFCAEHPAADLLRRKQFYWYVELPAEVATTPAVYSEIRKRFRAAAPLVEFLNAPLTESAAKMDIRDLLL